ncbi:MAG TPA: SDR family NAD(P)-dependent oxidoreductase [Clostridiaceae bacterium]|jgi:short-subunit dehydrogenase|nr:SDR family NAD(P)-dependent oxidoreductase [Clostridiaceae bacterium]
MNVMITGASGGLGRVLAIECALRGYNLFLTDINQAGLLSLKQGLERQFKVCIAVKACDLTKAESVDELMSFIDFHGIRFDMLINVAGIDYEGGFLSQEREKITKIIALNNEATLRITHDILLRRRPKRQFSLIFVSSLASMYPMPLKATYAASKRFLLDFALALRQELKNQNVTVLTLCPGGLVTTKEAMRGISAQGFWGNATTNSLEIVARKTINYALQGKSIYIPGLLNRILSFVGKILPRSWVATLIYFRWGKAQVKWQR